MVLYGQVVRLTVFVIIEDRVLNAGTMRDLQRVLILFVKVDKAVNYFNFFKNMGP